MHRLPLWATIAPQLRLLRRVEQSETCPHCGSPLLEYFIRDPHTGLPVRALHHECPACGQSYLPGGSSLIGWTVVGTVVWIAIGVLLLVVNMTVGFVWLFGSLALCMGGLVLFCVYVGDIGKGLFMVGVTLSIFLPIWSHDSSIFWFIFIPGALCLLIPRRRGPTDVPAPGPSIIEAPNAQVSPISLSSPATEAPVSNAPAVIDSVTPPAACVPAAPLATPTTSMHAGRPRSDSAGAGSKTGTGYGPGGGFWTCTACGRTNTYRREKCVGCQEVRDI